ncbi:MAG: lysozyme inhibitor LprI family protein [Janthinobacterium lividum]
MNHQAMRFVLGSLVCGLAMQAGAQESKPLGTEQVARGALTPAYGRCMETTGTTTIGMHGCIATESTLQDARLNRVYSAVLKLLPPARQKKLRDVQRAWIKFRDADCIFLHDPDGGTLAGVSSAACFMRKTAERAGDLEELLPR